jgi:hypothetical protein
MAREFRNLGLLLGGKLQLFGQRGVGQGGSPFATYANLTEQRLLLFAENGQPAGLAFKAEGAKLRRAVRGRNSPKTNGHLDGLLFATVDEAVELVFLALRKADLVGRLRFNGHSENSNEFPFSGLQASRRERKSAQGSSDPLEGRTPEIDTTLAMLFFQNRNTPGSTSFNPNNPHECRHGKANPPTSCYGGGCVHSQGALLPESPLRVKAPMVIFSS